MAAWYLAVQHRRQHGHGRHHQGHRHQRQVPAQARPQHRDADRLAPQAVPDVFGQRLRAGVAAPGILLQRPGGDRPQLARQPHGLAPDDLVVHIQRGIGLERAPARHRLVQQHAQRPDVDAGPEAAPLYLLGRHVMGRAHHAAGDGQVLAVQQLGDAEVGQHHAALGLDQDVGRLQIAVNDALAVGVVDGAGDRLQDLHPLVHRQARPQLGQRPPGDEIHHDVVGADLVHRHDVRVVQPRRRRGLDPQAIGRAVAQDLDRHLATQVGVARLEHVAGPAVGNTPHHLVLAERVWRGRNRRTRGRHEL